MSKQVRSVLTNSFLAIRLGGRCGAAAKTDSLAGRVWRGRKLLDEVIHSALDLLDVAFHGIHPSFKVSNSLDLVKSIQQHLAKDSRRPLAEARSL